MELEDSYPKYEDLVFNDAIRLAAEAIYYLGDGKSYLGNVDREEVDRAWSKLRDEFLELREAHASRAPTDELADEVGDVIICLIKFSLLNRFNIQDALAATIRKCDKRFDYMRQQAGDELMNLSQQERLELFKEAKQFE